jgi:hypothetical protein
MLHHATSLQRGKVSQDHHVKIGALLPMTGPQQSREAGMALRGGVSALPLRGGEHIGCVAQETRNEEVRRT